ncbi:hypothetical protein ACWCQW_54870 [Streptomyces mirabilis]
MLLSPAGSTTGQRRCHGQTGVAGRVFHLGQEVGSADCVEDAEGVAESVGSTAPATVDGAEGADGFGGT